jgi:hypothetical protein
MQIVKAVIGSSAFAVIFASAPALAQSRIEQLKGDYAFTSTSACAVSSAIVTPTSYTLPAGFSPTLVPLGPTTDNSSSSTGVGTFNGDGTGTIVARTVSLGSPVNSGAVSALDVVIPFAYSVAPDRTLTIEQGPSLNTFVAGQRVGQQNSSSDVPTLVGHLSSDGKSIVFGTFDPGVETLTRVSPPVPNPIEAVRICHRSFTGVRIGVPGSQGNGDD